MVPKGLFFYSAYGVDAKDYQMIAEVIRTLVPHEDFILQAKVIAENEFTVPENVEAGGMKKGKKYLLYVIDHAGRNNIQKITAKQKIKKLFPFMEQM